MRGEASSIYIYKP